MILTCCACLNPLSPLKDRCIEHQLRVRCSCNRSRKGRKESFLRLLLRIWYRVNKVIPGQMPPISWHLFNIGEDVSHKHKTIATPYIHSTEQKETTRRYSGYHNSSFNWPPLRHPWVTDIGLEVHGDAADGDQATLYPKHSVSKSRSVDDV